MILINKQKFLAELGRLLTFMSEEDRQEALTLYAKMFDDVEDEQALLQSLLSPTRQAVIIARAYDANARKLQARAKARRDEDEDDDNTPDFVLAILHVYEECVPLLPEEEVTEDESVMADQFSLFEDDGQPTEESVYEETFVLHETPEVQPQPEEAEVALPEEENEDLSPAPETEAEAETEAPAETAETPDEVDAFIANFSIQDNEIAEAPAESTPLVLEERQIDSVDEEEEVRALVEDLLDEEEDVVLVRKPRVVLLVLFVLLALPLTLLAVGLLLIPTLLSLVLAAVMIAAGCAGLIAAFGGFPVLADILVVLGCAVIALALGLLLLWLFIWFVGTAIGGLIRSVIRLGGSWCYKEVAA